VSPRGHRLVLALNGGKASTQQPWALTQALSFALLKLGFEPLHATAVLVKGGAIAFLGDCGTGKSTLAAAFLKSGDGLVCDDLLVTTPGRDGSTWMAHPGLPRVKLLPDSARVLLSRTGPASAPGSPKRIIPLNGRQICRTPVPLKAIYVLRPRRDARIAIRSLTRPRACLQLIANTYNPIALEPERLSRQFDWASRLVEQVPVRSLSYPKRLGALPRVRAAVLEDLRR
jgi:hypothetical protein